MSPIPISDIDVLRNAVRFSTAQRAFAAQMLRDRLASGVDQSEIAYLCVEGLAHFVTASEDLLGWIQVLREWNPDDPEKQLYVLLDNVQVKPSDEDEILRFLKGLDVPGFRNLLRIPPSTQLLANGLEESLVGTIDQAIPHILDGVIRHAEVRIGKSRGLVDAFNKTKHMLLVFPEANGYLRFARVGSGAALKGLRVKISAGYAAGRVKQAIQCQAMLSSTLALILTSNGHFEESAPWVANATLLWDES